MGKHLLIYRSSDYVLDGVLDFLKFTLNSIFAHGILLTMPLKKKDFPVGNPRAELEIHICKRNAAPRRLRGASFQMHDMHQRALHVECRDSGSDFVSVAQNRVDLARLFLFATLGSRTFLLRDLCFACSLINNRCLWNYTKFVCKLGAKE